MLSREYSLTSRWRAGMYIYTRVVRSRPCRSYSFRSGAYTCDMWPGMIGWFAQCMDDGPARRTRHRTQQVERDPQPPQPPQPQPQPPPPQQQQQPHRSRRATTELRKRPYASLACVSARALSLSLSCTHTRTRAHALAVVRRLRLIQSPRGL